MWVPSVNTLSGHPFSRRHTICHLLKAASYQPPRKTHSANKRPSVKSKNTRQRKALGNEEINIRHTSTLGVDVSLSSVLDGEETVIFPVNGHSANIYIFPVSFSCRGNFLTILNIWRVPYRQHSANHVTFCASRQGKFSRLIKCLLRALCRTLDKPYYIFFLYISRHFLR